MNPATIPTFSAPNPIAVNPYLNDIEEYVRSFATSIGVTGTDEGRRRLSAGYGRLVALTYPEADFGDLTLCAKWLFLTFLLDDLHTNAKYDSPQQWEPLRSRLQLIIDSGGTEGESPQVIMQALADLCRRTRARTSPGFYRRFALHLEMLLRGFLEESKNRAAGLYPSIDSFVHARRLSVGMWFGFDLIELSQKFEIPDRVFATAQWQQLVHCAVDIVAWQNDMWSLRIDKERGDIHNFLLALTHTRGLTDEQALAEVTAEINNRIDEFETTESQLPDLLRRLDLDTATQLGTRRAAAGIRQWTNACLVWYGQTTRYDSPGAVEPKQQHSYIEELFT
ncbi:hypothetical protein Rhe02_18510 [Rhizocola hellebori]|uniref:Terpene synthase n=1 Tax=Rhizocola hellebori TaxID=1392758 RepID=A0A8J3Q5I3_9ACTN|nr:terpene synthase family protein [Rhizocola hellebori]GIH03784.1 hypothetical protein Rhe02_18510 [Rhizocola hellebori]